MPTTREGRWQEDVAYFEAELPKRHRDLFVLVPPEDFRKALSELRRDMSKLSDAEIVIRLMRIVASPRVAHTRLNWSKTPSIFRRYLIEMRWFSDGLAVVATTSAYREAIGTRVLRIGPLTPDQLQKSLVAYVPHENEPWLREESPKFMILAELLQYLQVSAPDGTVDFSLAKNGGEALTVRFSPVECNMGQKDFISAMTALQIPTPISSRHPELFYWCEFLPDSRTLYLQYSRCRDAPAKSFADFVSETFASSAINSLDRAVVDLRFNPGGNSELILPLLENLQKNPALSGKGHLYVLIGARTFSSGLNNAMYFKDRLGAILVGAPTGGKPNSYGEVKTLKLPRSGLTVDYPTRYFRSISDSDPLSLSPDVPVAFNLKDYLTGRDPAFEAALNHPM